MEVLIVGASGRLGGRVAEQLLDLGVQVRAGTREPARVEALVARGATAVTCDLRDTATLGRAVRGVDAVLHAAHALVPPSRRNSSRKVDGLGVHALIDAAVRHDVKHFVLASVLASAPDHPSAFVRAKHAAEVALHSSGMAYTVLRIAAFTQTHVLMLLGEPIADSKPVRIVGDGLQPRNFVDVADVADVAVGCLTGPPPVPGATLDIAGPANLTTNEAIAVCERVLDTRARVQRLPARAAQAATAVSRVLYPPVTPLLSLLTDEARNGSAVDLTPRPDLLVGATSVADSAAAWVPSHRAEAQSLK